MKYLKGQKERKKERKPQQNWQLRERRIDTF